MNVNLKWLAFTSATTYRGCTGCISYRRACAWAQPVTVPTCNDGEFFAQSGALTIQDAAYGTTGNMVVSWTAIRLTEWDFTADAPVSGGRCFLLQPDNASTNVVTPP